MNVLAIVSATLTCDGRETAILSPAEGKPLLGLLLDRLSGVDKLAGVVVTTSDEPEDQPIRDYCEARGTVCESGPRDDLLGRLLGSLKATGAKGGVMIDARNPLIDPALVDQVANLLQMTDGMLDWIGNTLTQTWPKGMEIDGFTTAALEEAGTRASPEQRREGPAFLRQNSRVYRPLSLTAPPELACPKVRLDLEGPQDLPRIESIIRHFSGRTDFSLAEILAYLDQAH
ncbi:spore coat biosynthesis protein F [Methylocystis heyeri]|uniref:Spore coat biosynthesis protein F n=1 Tax=Methylocystis heyeri TaxID=391905 RepID=A0A6B8KGR1_9HYPH|nr:spore coat biosynthesis protein F [Methylocystis heyeri]QGM45663.1 spore coat biosynthesis protein F [Methylocystis heyeri]